MRHERELENAPAASHTPIYDTLYSEYLRAFRTLPGDRSGEEDLGFTAFSYGGSYTAAASGTYGGPGAHPYGGWNGSSWQQADAWQASYAPQPAPQPPSQHSYAGAGAATATGTGYANGRQHQTGMQHIPAALPPAPRRGN
ncbi:hypothetical protein ABZY44_31000 [Streptomyces sp. NPDC006544]|uniref:hypothetical protein n=1 Tax=Streptomyces sp. NPDC006544 TaxID=3154583 RepID=UPI00339EB406